MIHLFPALTLVSSLVCFASGTANITGGLSFVFKQSFDESRERMIYNNYETVVDNFLEDIEDCAKNGSLLIFGTDAASYGSVYATQSKGTTNTTECTSSRHGNEQNVSFEIKGCNISFPINVILMHEKQNSTEEAKVVGGKNILFYNLTCNNIPIGGFSFQTKLNLTESENVTYEPYMEPTLTVMMEVRANGSSITNKPVLIGTELQLSISCEVGFNIVLEICIATDVSHKNSKTLLISGSSMDMDLLSNFTDMNTATVAPIASSTPPLPRHSMEAKLYAFHFVGSNTIEIVCNITVCQSDDNTCPSNPVPTPVIPAPRSSTTGSTPATASTIKPSPPNSARRKRNVVPDRPRTEMLRTDLRVVDTFKDINDMNMKASGNSKDTTIGVGLVVLAVNVARTLM